MSCEAKSQFSHLKYTEVFHIHGSTVISIIMIYLIGLSRLCQHFFENNRHELAFENNASIIGGICQNFREEFFLCG